MLRTRGARPHGARGGLWGPCSTKGTPCGCSMVGAAGWAPGHVPRSLDNCGRKWDLISGAGGSLEGCEPERGVLATGRAVPLLAGWSSAGVGATPTTPRSDPSALGKHTAPSQHRALTSEAPTLAWKEVVEVGSDTIIKVKLPL